jgi:hypothetical protein
MFSPLAAPLGMIVYDLTTSLPPQSHLNLSPFETFREPLAIIALADGTELGHISYGENGAAKIKRDSITPQERDLRSLYQELEAVRDNFPKALVHQMLLFDYVHSDAYGPLHEGLVAVPSPERSTITTMKTIMCDISSLLLAEMTTFAKSVQGMTMVDSPSLAQNGRQNGLWANGLDNLSRRNSQYTLPTRDSRSNSPGNLDRSHARMSMPVIRSDSEKSNTLGRPVTPVNRNTSPAPTTFDEMAGVKVSGPESPERGLTRANTADMAKSSSQERVPVQGFGSGSLSERARNKAKGRIDVVIGSLYLHAGRWADALRELVEGAFIAKTNNDHLWHAKGLENILVCLLMMAWTGLDFQIPQICYTSSDKSSASVAPTLDRSTVGNRLVSLRNLGVLLPELLEKILNLYNRAANFTGEALPQHPFSETVIRFSKLLAAVHLSGGNLDDNVLGLIVEGKPFSEAANVRQPRLNIHPTRTEIVTNLFRAFPSTTAENFSLIDRTVILGGIASVLGSLGFNRKKAMVMRELVSVLIPGLVQARKVGAAEMGVHPAAGLAALNSTNGFSTGAAALDLGEGDVESGIDGLLGLIGRIYGVVSFDPPSADPTNYNSIDHDAHDDSDEAIISRAVQNASIRAFGGQNMKINVLRACIDLCEALPDFHGVLRFTTDLLRTAGSGIAPGPRTENALPYLAREDQVRMAMNISRTVGAANKLGLKNLEAEYWDEFLVRGVELEALSPSKTPIPHKRKELEGTRAVEVKEKNPFIYNPFLKKPDTASTNHLLVVGETAVFKVTLQNPYEMDLDIESVTLEAHGCELDSIPQGTLIGPYRSQIMTVTATPKSAGSLNVTGCFIKVRGCRRRRFPIFTEPWEPQREVKVKAIGLAASMSSVQRPLSGVTDAKKIVPPMSAPKVASLALDVIEQQPAIVIKSSTLLQSAIMILEGEKKTISVTLQNLSTTTPADLVLFSFQDSTQAKTHAAMSNKSASAADLYDLEIIFSRKPALRWKRSGDEQPFIGPGETATFEIEMLGKPGLTNATIQVDYAYIGVPYSEVNEQFHTRQVSLPLSITVNASIELARLDVLPLSGNIPTIVTAVETSSSSNVSKEKYCLLVLDLRNAWPTKLQVCLALSNGTSITEEVLPGNTIRVPIPITRIFLADPHAPVPTLDPAKQRQFVVSSDKISPETERTNREAFWYREEILKLLSGSWRTCDGMERIGDIEFRALRLNARMIDSLKIDDVSVEISVKNNNPIDSEEDSVAKNGHTHVLPMDEFFTLLITITNRLAHPVSPLLRLQPAVKNQPHSIALDLNKKLAWNGTLQSRLDVLGPGETRVESLSGIALCRGIFEIGGSVEEVRVWEDKEKIDEDAKDDGARKRAASKSLYDAVLGDKERRVWHTRESCILTVVDGDEDD